MLLGWKEVNLNKPCPVNRAPLSYAAQYGHEGAVKILLGQGEVLPDEPLLVAAETGHERVMKMLLGRKEVSPDKS